MSLAFCNDNKADTRYKNVKCVFYLSYRLEKDAALSKFEEEVKLLADRQGKKQVMDILGEVEDGKNACKAVRKAKNMLLAKYSRTTDKQEHVCVPNEKENGEESMLITTV